MKWTEVVPLKNMTHKEAIHFILENIVHRFGIPQTLTMDQGSSFMSHQIHEFAESLKIELFSSLPCYAQANGGMKCYRRHYGHIASPSIALQK
jgi:transposase InsO family protein